MGTQVDGKAPLGRLAVAIWVAVTVVLCVAAFFASAMQLGAGAP
jgi:hypothetical protein